MSETKKKTRVHGTARLWIRGWSCRPPKYQFGALQLGYLRKGEQPGVPGFPGRRQALGTPPRGLTDHLPARYSFCYTTHRRCVCLTTN